jgi:hypothetical protein
MIFTQGGRFAGYGLYVQGWKARVRLQPGWC